MHSMQRDVQFNALNASRRSIQCTQCVATFNSMHSMRQCTSFTRNVNNNSFHPSCRYLLPAIVFPCILSTTVYYPSRRAVCFNLFMSLSVECFSNTDIVYNKYITVKMCSHLNAAYLLLSPLVIAYFIGCCYHLLLSLVFIAFCYRLLALLVIIACCYCMLISPIAIAYFITCSITCCYRPLVITCHLVISPVWLHMSYYSLSATNIYYKLNYDSSDSKNYSLLATKIMRCYILLYLFYWY